MIRSVPTEYRTLCPRSLQHFIEITLETLNTGPSLPGLARLNSKMFLSAFSPVCPEEMDWSELYPHFFAGGALEKQTSRVEFADIGCGYGGLLGSSLNRPHSPAPDLTELTPSSISPLCLFCHYPVELSPLFPDKLMLGLEIRVKVSDYVRDRIQSLRATEPGSYQNIACLRSNAMKYLPNFFSKGQVSNCICLFVFAFLDHTCLVDCMMCLHCEYI